MWFAQNPMASQHSGAFCKMNVPLNLVGKFKNQTYHNTSAVTFPPHPEITNKYATHPRPVPGSYYSSIRQGPGQFGTPALGPECRGTTGGCLAS